MDRRNFIAVSGAFAAGTILGTGAIKGAESRNNSKVSQVILEEKKMSKKIVVAADPFAVVLKDAIVAHLKKGGYEVIDVGARAENPEIPYFESAPLACKYIQDGTCVNGILLCGTGMGMSIVANKCKGIRASVVESVFATKMCRTINDSNVLCLGAMIWGEAMALDAVDTFLGTAFTSALPQFADFLKAAAKKVDAFDQAQLK